MVLVWLDADPVGTVILIVSVVGQFVLLQIVIVLVWLDVDPVGTVTLIVSVLPVRELLESSMVIVLV